MLPCFMASVILVYILEKVRDRRQFITDSFKKSNHLPVFQNDENILNLWRIISMIVDQINI